MITLSCFFRDQLGSYRFTPRRIVGALRRRSLAFAIEVQLRLRSICAGGSVLGSADVVVSMTTHGVRLKRTHLTIEAIARGKVRPQCLVLWLEPQDIANLPPSLIRLTQRGLTIKETPNYGPHTKYLPHVLAEGELKRPLVTADDDVLYPRYWLRDLIDAYAVRPQGRLIHCHRAHVVQVRQGTVGPYNDWEKCRSIVPSNANFATGVSGVLYPPEFLATLRAHSDEGFRRAPTADDVWLHSVAVRNDWRIRQVSATAAEFPTVMGSQKGALRNMNVYGARNDAYISECYDESVLRRLVKSFGFPPSK